jgi:pyruvate kinase
MTDRATRHAFLEGFAKAGDRVLVVAGVPFGQSGGTNNLRIAVVNEDGSSQT